MKHSKKRLAEPVVLFVSVEATQHETLRQLAFLSHRSLADVVRQALTEFLARQENLPVPNPGTTPHTETHPRAHSAETEYDSPFHAKETNSPAK